MPVPTPELTRTTIDGLTVELTDSGGPGSVLLLVHAGVFGAWFEPLAAQEALAAHRVIRLVRPGYTSAARPEAPVTVEAHAAVCAGVLDDLGVTAAHVVGHSSGSVISLELALRRPDLVRSLVLGEPPLISSLAHPDDLQVLETVVGPAVGGAIGTAMAGDVEGAFDAFMAMICGPDHRSVIERSLGPRSVDRAIEDAAFFFADEAGAVAGWSPSPEQFAGIQAPTLLVQGSDSPPMVHRLVARTAARLPSAQVATLDGDNHLLPLRSPGRLADLVAGWARTCERTVRDPVS